MTDLITKPHKELTPDDGIHGVIAARVADAAARAALGWGADAVGKVVLQADGTFWTLRPAQGGGVEWYQFGAPGPAGAAGEPGQQGAAGSSGGSWYELGYIDFRTAVQTQTPLPLYSGPFTVKDVHGYDRTLQYKRATYGNGGQVWPGPDDRTYWTAPGDSGLQIQTHGDAQDPGWWGAPGVALRLDQFAGFDPTADHAVIAMVGQLAGSNAGYGYSCGVSLAHWSGLDTTSGPNAWQAQHAASARLTLTNQQVQVQMYPIPNDPQGREVEVPAGGEGIGDVFTDNGYVTALVGVYGDAIASSPAFVFKEGHQLAAVRKGRISHAFDLPGHIDYQTHNTPDFYRSASTPRDMRWIGSAQGNSDPVPLNDPLWAFLSVYTPGYGYGGNTIYASFRDLRILQRG